MQGELSKYLSEFTSSEVSTISTVLEVIVSFVSGWIVAVVTLSPGSLTDLVVVAPPFVVVIAIAIIALVYSKFEKNTSEILRYSHRANLRGIVHYSELLSQCCDYLRHSGYTDEEALYCYNLDIVKRIASKVRKILEDESKK
jgi:hypothetical protein